MVGSKGLTNKHETKLERPAVEKHSSLLQTFINYGLEKFYNIRLRMLACMFFIFGALLGYACILYFLLVIFNRGSLMVPRHSS